MPQRLKLSLIKPLDVISTLQKNMEVRNEKLEEEKNKSPSKDHFLFELKLSLTT